MIRQINEGKRENRTVALSADLVVAGGGLSGVCCALSAARAGSHVVLVQDRPVLGGNASSEVRVWALGATSHMGNNNRWAREGGIIDELMLENLYRNPEGNPLFFDTLLLDKVMGEKNITLLLNTAVFDAEISRQNKITALTAFNPQNQTIYKLTAPLFCDASGDGIVGYLAGASYRCGAEEQDEFGEGFSPKDGYGELLGHTIFLYTKKADHPVEFIAPGFALKDMERIPKLNQITPEQYGCNYWWFEYGGSLDTIAQSEEIKPELWSVVYGAWDYIKNSGLYPEAANLTLEWVGMIPGKRESRRFEGLYMLTQPDIVNQTHFADAVAYGGWAVDLHPAEGVYSSAPSCNQYHSEGIYEIPYRCYVSRDVENLFLAGRLISASHVAFGSTRVMITCALGGQAVGQAARLCAERGCLPADLLNDETMVELQQRLAVAGQSIPTRAISEEANLAAAASISASSTMVLMEMAFDGNWRKLEMSMGQLLPLKSNTAYSITFEVNADEPTTLCTELIASQKPENFTPNKLIERQILSVNNGEQMLRIDFLKTLDADCYAFVILRENSKIRVRMSNQRLTGILSVFNRQNKAVNNLGRQIPPEGSGFREFEFFTPERRPCGENLAFAISPALNCFSPQNLVNGLLRPRLTANAWVAKWSDEQPELTIDFGEEKSFQEIILYFDTDADHPLETIQWQHPEREMPFCVSRYSIFDDANRELYRCEANHQTINRIRLTTLATARKIRIKLERKHANIPVSLFQIIIRL